VSLDGVGHHAQLCCRARCVGRLRLGHRGQPIRTVVNCLDARTARSVASPR
jgi:hypothetical protein